MKKYIWSILYWAAALIVIVLNFVFIGVDYYIWVDFALTSAVISVFLLLYMLGAAFLPDKEKRNEKN